MGRIYNRSVRYVDSRVKTDSKLLKFVKMHPAIYDKNHKFYRNKQEQQKIWRYIAGCLGISVPTCKERWHQLIREYKNCKNVLTLHDVIFELIKECIRKDTEISNSYFDEIEDDVLVNLFSEPTEEDIMSTSPLILSIENIDRDTEVVAVDDHNAFLPAQNFSNHSVIFSGYSEFGESDSELFDEACSLPSYDMSFTTDDSYNYTMPWPRDLVASEDIFYNREEDTDDYYNFFMDNNLNKFPAIFDDIVESFFDHLDEDTCDEARGDIVKLLCEKIKRQKLQRRL